MRSKGARSQKNRQSFSKASSALCRSTYYCQLDPRKYRTTYLRTPLWDLHRSQKLGIPSVEVNYVFVYLCWRILAKCIAVHIVSPTTITWASGCTIGGRNQKQKLLPREQDTRCQRRIAPPPYWELYYDSTSNFILFLQHSKLYTVLGQNHE